MTQHLDRHLKGISLGGGDSYCVGFGGAAGGVEIRDDAQHWAVKNPLGEVCPATPSQ